MENELRFGGSLPVPCVKELAKEQLPTVPKRYVRANQDHPIALNSSSLPQVPVIDMQKLYSHQEESFKFELEKLHQACKDWGFFQLINHGVSSLLVEQVKEGIQELFDLPLEEKKKFWQQAGDVEGFGQAFVVSEDQKLDWGDMYYMLTLPAHLRKPHLFPKLPLPFRGALVIEENACH
uniref:Non-haem dioxygenase N-terminal domain-containing protein n=1 Tax=Rhizophora mucronata TaxID=61149 RepID=A0A2P2IL18_RHIMU